MIRQLLTSWLRATLGLNDGNAFDSFLRNWSSPSNFRADLGMIVGFPTHSLGMLRGLRLRFVQLTLLNRHLRLLVML
jgi:hypothetical protein